MIRSSLKAPQDDRKQVARRGSGTRGAPASRTPATIDGSRATPRQQERYQSVIDATLGRLHDVGFEATRIQDIADLSGVALGTIYRYFKSRDQLIYIATQRWLTETTEAAVPTGAKARGALEPQLIQVIRRSARALIKEPRLLEAWARSSMSNDPVVVELVREHRIEDAMRMFPPGRITDGSLLNDLVLVMEHIWFAGIVRWAYGQKDYEQVHKDVERGMLMALNAHRTSPDLAPKG